MYRRVCVNLCICVHVHTCVTHVCVEILQKDFWWIAMSSNAYYIHKNLCACKLYIFTQTIVCEFTCIHVCTCMCILTCIYACVCIHRKTYDELGSLHKHTIYIQKYAYKYACVYIMYTHINTRVYTHKYTCIYIYTRACIYAYMYMCVSYI